MTPIYERRRYFEKKTAPSVTKGLPSSYLIAASTAATVLPVGISASAETPPTPPAGYAAYYSFNNTAAENEKLTVIKPGNWQGVNPVSGADDSAQAVYSENKARYGKSLDLTSGSYGVMLDEVIPADSSYTVHSGGT